MIKPFIVYTVATGLIKRTGTAPINMISIQAGAGEAVIEGVADVNSQYILDGEITNKPVFPSVINKNTVNADSIDEINITNVPPGTWMLLVSDENGIRVAEIVDDGDIDLVFDIDGQYKLSLSCFPYLDYEVTIDAV